MLGAGIENEKLKLRKTQEGFWFSFSEFYELIKI